MNDEGVTSLSTFTNSSYYAFPSHPSRAWMQRTLIRGHSALHITLLLPQGCLNRSPALGRWLRLVLVGQRRTFDALVRNRNIGVHLDLVNMADLGHYRHTDNITRVLYNEQYQAAICVACEQFMVPGNGIKRHLRPFTPFRREVTQKGPAISGVRGASLSRLWRAVLWHRSEFPPANMHSGPPRRPTQAGNQLLHSRSRLG